MQEERKSNFEVLRLLCMILIISFHYVFEGGFDFSGRGVTVNKLFVDLFDHFGELGVNCFILISGYFLPDMKFRWSKVFLLVCETEFYVLSGRFFLIFIGQAEVGTWSWKEYLFPVLRTQYYWFVTVYVLIYILSPYLCKLVHVLSKKEFKELLVTQYLIWSIFPTFILGFLYDSVNTEAMNYYSRFVWLLVVYLTGAYIRFYGTLLLNNIKKSITCFCLIFFIIILYILGTEFCLFPWQGKTAEYFWPPNSFLQILLSISLFMVFVYIQVPYNKLINYMASCTLGIYMLHNGVLASFFWTNVFHNASHIESRYFLFHIVAAVIFIMLAGIIVDSMRKLFEKYIIKGIHFIFWSDRKRKKESVI